ncbi:hypothetical protein [Accumulibacter sp.]|uniref:hypothetical protein n=1 Tax=Accumulibacter sp. TaxID=2053492 RepID=UPI00260F0796|nr:hypothetical protein [Accumulibacter sp.]
MLRVLRLVVLPLLARRQGSLVKPCGGGLPGTGAADAGEPLRQHGKPPAGRA